MKPEVKFSISEVKSFLACERQWSLSSRNRTPLRALETSTALKLGTIFHESLAYAYNRKEEANLEQILMTCAPHLQNDKDFAILSKMLTGYFQDVLPTDLEKWEILEIEYCFNHPLVTLSTKQLDVYITGAIDLIVYEAETNTIWGIEHKTAKAYRESTFAQMDAQPRLYAEMLTTLYLKDAISRNRVPSDAKVGGIIINEVKKLSTKFDYKRTVMQYDNDSRLHFNANLTAILERMLNTLEQDFCAPTTHHASCSYCSFKNVCLEFTYKPVTVDTILHHETLSEQFKVRTVDYIQEHLLSFNVLEDGGNNDNN